VLSENPPGAKAHLGAFPKRNRIIAALVPVTIVVEAGFKSGALNTAFRYPRVETVSTRAAAQPKAAKQTESST
jgi:DNA recombination-mediator protein A